MPDLNLTALAQEYGDLERAIERGNAPSNAVARQATILKVVAEQPSRDSRDTAAKVAILKTEFTAAALDLEIRRSSGTIEAVAWSLVRDILNSQAPDGRAKR